jgi:signal transduction histidine kinase
MTWLSTRQGPCARDSCPIPHTLNDGTFGKFVEHRIVRSDGVHLLIEGSSTPIVVEGRTTGAVLSLRDVTAQKNLESQLQQARKLEAIGQLAAGIAHEINTPMQFIGDNVRFLQGAIGDMQVVLEGYRSAVQGDASLASDVRRSLEQLEQDKDIGYLIENTPQSCESALMGVARVSKIVYAMKEFSHSGGAEKTLADLNRAIESTATVATSVWKHVAELELRLEAGLPTPPVHLGEINQVVLNLIVNAAHAIGDVVKDGAKGRITLSTHHDDTHVEIRVADTGTGIPESARDRIFTPFFTTKEIGKGTGQGLSLARSVVNDRHHGTITFETEMGRGTTFIVRLPLQDPAAPGAQTAKK